jgi:3-hydroxyisobutyrate dehydrogenase-like beta-hydroxyacid dehydrogenase
MQIVDTDIGLLHPGAMGAEIGRALLVAAPDRRVVWAGAGRSAESRQRADSVGLDDVDTLEAMVASVGVIVSVCPPGAALEQARAVAATGFAGRYLDANAVSPATARSIAAAFGAEVSVIDGGIIGPPPTKAGTTRLHLSGDEAVGASELFAGSDLEVRVVDGGPGAASAVKMCFAGWTKGTSALLFALRAMAEAEGVTDALLGEWETSMPDLIVRSERSAATVGPKAWRFEAEMHEIADSLAGAGLPDGFHRAAAEIYQRMAGLKGRPATGAEATTLTEVMATLMEAD